LARLALNVDVTFKQFNLCEASAIPLLGSVGEAPSTGELQDLANGIDYLLWTVFNAHPETAAFWTDGVEAESIERTGGGLAFSGLLWCADHRDQWRVPIRAELQLSDEPTPRLMQIRLLIADGSKGGLRQQPVGKFRAPEEWLCEFLVSRPPSELVAPEPVLEAVRAWLNAHPGGKLVDRDWQLLPEGAAESLIRERARAGISVVLRASWLDGGDVLQLDQAEST
jgi:hypothetical protein